MHAMSATEVQERIQSSQSLVKGIFEHQTSFRHTPERHKSTIHTLRDEKPAAKKRKVLLKAHHAISNLFRSGLELWLKRKA
jgi:hypothetical protein